MNNPKEPNLHTIFSESVKLFDINFVVAAATFDVIWFGGVCECLWARKCIDKNVSLADLDDYGEPSVTQIVSKSTLFHLNL